LFDKVSFKEKRFGKKSTIRYLLIATVPEWGRENNKWTKKQKVPTKKKRKGKNIFVATIENIII
jgi:hypothetical protein